MSPLRLAALALSLSLASPALAQEREPRTETYSTGIVKAEYEVVLVDGEEVPDGKYLSFHPDGSREFVGRHKGGLRTGTWKSWFPDKGRKRSEGKYSNGLRRGAWKVWTAEGALDERESGTYATVEVEHEDGSLRASGEALDGVPHGAWVFHWPHGAEMARGEFLQGKQDGSWVFRHGDGFVDPAWITGIYRDGRKRADLDPAALPASGELRAWPSLPIAAELTDDLRDQARRELVRLGDSDDAEQIKASATALWGLGLRADAILLAELESLDPADARHASRAHRIESHLLAPLCSWALFGWRAPGEEHAPEDNALVLRRWKSLFSLARVDPSFLDFGLHLSAPPREKNGYLDLAVLPPPMRLPEVPGTLASAPGTTLLVDRLAQRKRLERRETKALVEPLENALAWLARHQWRDGSWSNSVFEGQQDLVEACGCGGVAESRHTIGVTSLALMALVVDGSTPTSGPYRDQVSRAVGFLVRQQDPGSGQLLRHMGGDLIYDHALATQALLEVHAVTGDELLVRPIQSAVEYIVRARNPYSAWRYSVPPIGRNDTSVTAWMMSALVMARQQGFTLEDDRLQAALDGGISWIDEVTDAANGRTGYDTIGSLSARVVGVNEDYPREGTEAMTAAAMYCRLRVGQDPQEHPVVAKHTELLLRAQPEWSEKGELVDFYYWYYATGAMQLLGGKPASTWWRSLQTALLAHQILDEEAHEFGSWDPVGVWGHACGRSGATALGALTLQSYFRHASSAE